MKKFTTEYVEQVVVKALGEQSDAQREFRVWLHEIKMDAADEALTRAGHWEQG